MRIAFDVADSNLIAHYLISAAAIALALVAAKSLLRFYRRKPLPIAQLADDAILSKTSLQAELLSTLDDLHSKSDRQRNLIKNIFDGAPEAMLEIDLCGTIRSANSGAARIFAVNVEDLIGRPFGGLYASAASWNSIHRDFEINRDSYSPPPKTVEFRRDNCEAFTGSISGSVLRDDHDNAAGFIAVVRDITQERQRETALDESKRLEALGRLTAGIAHDFNNLLTVISVNLQLIDMSVHSRDLKRKVQAALLATNMGAKLNQRLTGMAHKRQLNAVPVSLNSIVRDLQDVLRAGLGERSTLKLALEPELHLTNVDVSEVENMLINLVINAKDAMPDGGLLDISTCNQCVTGDLENRGALTPGKYVVLAVHDTGIGMSPHTLAQATEPFYTTKNSGSGLGLPAVNEFVRQCNGQLLISSVEGQGTTVTIYLPAICDAGESDLADALAGRQRKSLGKILVVEDNPAVLDAVRHFLQTLGYRALSASDASEALQAVADHEDIKLMFTDLVLPGGGSGIDLAQNIAHTRPGMRVIYTSGASDSARYKEVSNTHILQKPYALEDLQRAIAENFNRD